MTISVTVNKNSDGSPDGTATIRSMNASGGAKLDAQPEAVLVEFTDELDHVASALGYGLEQIRQAKANEDPAT